MQPRQFKLPKGYHTGSIPVIDDDPDDTIDEKCACRNDYSMGYQGMIDHAKTYGKAYRDAENERRRRQMPYKNYLERDTKIE